MGADPSPSADAVVLLASQDDLPALRRATMEAAETAGMRPSERTRIATAASELGRNAVVHGGGGTATVRVVREGGRVGVRLEVVDQGPGIEDVERALGDGFTTGNGLGLGLGGARRLLGHLEIDAAPGSGTRVVGIRWA